MLYSIEFKEEAIENLCLNAGYEYYEAWRLGEIFDYTLHIVFRDKETGELKLEAGKKPDFS